MQPLSKPRSASIPVSLIATTNGEAAAELFDLLAKSKSGELFGNKHAEEQHTKNVKEQDPVECQPYRTGDRLARILSFAHCDSNKLNSEVGKRSDDHSTPESQELSLKPVLS